MTVPKTSLGSGASRSGDGFKLGYRPELDGIRGLAILLVLVSHATPWLTGGWLGVDLFFVLSGFLITTLLIEEWQDHSSISLRAFYVRRALRLLPALFVFLAVYGSVILIFFREGARFRAGGILAVLGYFANWQIAFRPLQFPSELAHLWSLSVEEQFYIVWPVLLVLALRKGVTLRGLKWMLLGVMVAVAAWRLVLVLQEAGEVRLYFGTDTRMDELFLGCLIAVLFRQEPRRFSLDQTATGLGALTFLLAMAIFDPLQDVTWSFVVGIPAIAFAAASLIWAATSLPDDSVLKRCLRFRGLVFLGLISYPLYLWQTPINALASDHLGMEGLSLYGAVIAMSVSAGAASYYFVELPFLAARKRFHASSGPSKADIEASHTKLKS